MVWRFDLVHLHLADNGSVYRKYAFLRISKLFGKKTLVHVHVPNGSFEQLNRNRKFIGRCFRYCLVESDVVICLSDSWKSRIEKVRVGSSVSVIYNPSPLVKNHVVNADQIGGCFTYLFLGYVIERKGYRDLIEAFSRVSQAEVRNGEAFSRLVFAGPGDLVQAKRECERLGVGDRVEFLGPVFGEHKFEVFMDSSCFVLPSYEEGMPMSLLEASSCRLPSIVTNVGGIPEVVNFGEDAILVTPGDVEGLKDAMLSMQTMKVRDKYVSGALRISEKYSTTSFHRSLVDLYRHTARGCV